MAKEDPFSKSSLRVLNKHQRTEENECQGNDTNHKTLPEIEYEKQVVKLEFEKRKNENQLSAEKRSMIHKDILFAVMCLVFVGCIVFLIVSFFANGCQLSQGLFPVFGCLLVSMMYLLFTFIKKPDSRNNKSEKFSFSEIIMFIIKKIFDK
ncbi:MAG: hypothetical protein Q4B92_07190 [Ruminococcus sp.]|nr:hypothetical protein [Ruminococcus sp.]